MKITINGNVIEGTPEELAEYFAMTEDFAKVDACEDVCCEDVTETITFEGAEYRKVDREAREGDVVIFKDQINPVEWITVGKPYEVTRGAIGYDGGEFIGDICGEFTIYRNDAYNRTRETVDVYEPIAVEKAYEPKEQAKWAKLGRGVNEFKKGDIVRATEMIQGHTAKYGGALGKVEDIAKDMVGIRYHNGYCGAYTPNGNVELVAPVEAIL